VCGETLAEPTTKDYDRPVQAAPATLVDSSTLPDLSSRKLEAENKATIEMSSFSSSSPEDVVLVFSPSGALEKPAEEQPPIEEKKPSEAPVGSETIILSSETDEIIPAPTSGMEPQTSIPRRRNTAATTILNEASEQQEAAPQRDKPTTRIDGAPFEFELEPAEVFTPPEGYPARPDEPLSEVLARTNKTSEATALLGTKQAVEDKTPQPQPTGGDTVVIEGMQPPETLPGFVGASAIEETAASFQNMPTSRIEDEPPATQIIPAEPIAPHPAMPETKVNLNEAALQAFGMGEKTPPRPTFTPPVKPHDVQRPPDALHVPVVMPMPTPPRGRSLAGIFSAVMVLIVLSGTVFALWWYITGGGRGPNRGAGNLSVPDLPANTSEPPPPVNATPAPPVGMALVPAGIYTLGRDLGDDLEKPAHKVEIKAFFIDVTEVTNQAYKEFVVATGHRQPDGWKNNTYPEGRANFPVTGVSWQDAADFAEWAGKRLPTEAEWEAAARGAEGRTYPWGNAWGEGLANIRGASATEVGQFKTGASPFGAFDMIGNVWEWTSDTLKLYPGSAASLDAVIDPNITYRVIRGGAFDRKDNINASFRGFVDASKGYDKTGFRCVKDIK
jgi:formylglycine-generating enzyme required for sulfatase activity